MSSKRKEFFTILSIVVIVNMITSMFLPSVSVFADTNSNPNIEVTVTTNKNKVESGDQIIFGLNYKVVGGPGSVKEGDVLEIKLPDEFKDLKPKFPVHFKDVNTDGNVVKATFGELANTALSGYIEIKATAKDVNKDTPISIEVNGKIKNLDASVVPKPKEPSNPGTNTRQLLKIVENSDGYEDGKLLGKISKPVVGKVTRYTIYLNEESSQMNNLVLDDTMPQGTELLKDSIKIYEIGPGKPTMDVTKEMMGNFKINPNSLHFQLDSTKNEYMIEYSVKYNKEYSEYINTANLTQDGKDPVTSSTIVRPTEYNDMVSKSYTSNNEVTNKDGSKSYVVSNVGDTVDYTIQINPNNASLKNATLEDTFPNGMELVDGSVNISQIDMNGKFSWVTDKFKDKINVSNNKMTINFGDANNRYTVRYKLKVTDSYKEYNNNAKILYNGTSQDVNSKINYEMNAGAINAQKLVDKTEIKKGDDQTVTYTINFDCYGYFNQNYLNLTDTLDSRLKIVSIEVPKQFTAKTDGNKITVVNDKGSIDYGDKLQVKIKVDFSNVPNGTTVKNVAKIDKSTTNEVETKKGYAFEAKKIDSYTKEALNGAKFEILNSDKQPIKTVTTNDEGVIKSDLDSAGDYYLKETEAPNGYVLDNTEKKFTIKDSDIGTVVNIGNLENNIKTGSVNLTKEDSETGGKLGGAEFKLYSSDNKEVGTYTTDTNGNLTVNNLRPGKYYFVETKAPEGYDLDNSKHEFEIVLGQTDNAVSIVVKNNIKKGTVQLIKKDSDTNEPLQGAVYGLYDSDNNLIEKAATDENGQAILTTSLRPGKYYFKEITAPKGYNLSDEKLPVEIKSGGIADPQAVVAKDSVILGSAKLIKVDSKTGGKLQGAVYGIYDSNNNLIDKVTTGSNGEVTKTDLRPGKYYFKEITAPVGYALNQTEYPFEIILGETTKVPEITANDDINLGSVNLTKEDSETSQRLEGAEFDLYKIKESSGSILSAIKSFINPESEKIGTYTTDENGLLKVSDLRPGKYYFVETKAPEGYDLDTSKHEFEIALGQTNEPAVVNVKDNIKKGEAVVVKQDSDTGAALQGAVYGLYDSSDNLIEEVTTDENGQAIASTKLRPGKYYFKEIDAPKGYNVSDEKLPIEIKSGGVADPQTVVAKDSVILGSAKLIKVDSKTGGKLQGAVYGVYDSNNNLIEKVTTGSTGEVSTKTDLRPGKYYFKEITAPVGYAVNETKYPFEIVLGETTKVPEVTAKDDINLGSVNLTKEDSETAQKLEGAEFKLYSSDNKELGTYKTDNNGDLTVNNLRPGKYYFVETKAPEGYDLDNSKHEFEITLGQTNEPAVVNVKDNIKKGEAVVVKQDSETGAALQGAVYGLYDSSDKLIEEVTTDENGQAIASTELRPGKYYFKEITAPKGYNVSDEKLPVEIKSGGVADPQTVIAKDSVILGSAKLIKIDSKTGGKLQGAVYGIYDSNNKLIDKVTTGSNGEVTKTDLRPGKYYFKEITAPVGYALNQATYPFEIILGETTKVPEVTVKDDINLGSVNLTKEDSETAQKLQGAEFKLYSSDDTEIGTYTTDNNGSLTVNNLRPGDYYFVETKAPEGYDLDNSKHDFSIVLGQTEKAASLIVKDNIKKGAVNLVKEDSETAQKLQGAEFDLYKVNTKATDNNALIRAIKDLITKDSVKIGTYTTDENGSITVNDLRPGDYYFVETKAPEGYNLDSSKQPFTINIGQTNKHVVVTVKDNIKKGEAVMVKKDSETGKALQGAVYGLYDSDNNLIEEVTTDENGQAIASTKLRPGKYYFKEIEAPKGYNVSDEKLPVEIKSGGVVTPETVVATDSVILGSAKLIKVDSKTGGKLQGAVYGIYDSNNNLIEKVTTGSTGEVSTKTDLRPGKYYFKEITAPVGYAVNENKYPFEIVLGETTKVPEITAKDNINLGSVNLIKKDSETSQELQGAEFKLYTSDNIEVGTYTTDNNGSLTVNNLRPGDYYFVETKAPEGYDLDNTKHDFKIVLGETEKQISVTVKDNIKKGSVNLVKEDSETTQKLQGAEFKLYTSDNTEIGTYTTDENGSIIVNNLRPGDYYFVETKAPEGYDLDSNKQLFTISMGKTDQAVVVTAKDNIKKGEAVVVKQDSETGAVLEGAVYGLYDSNNNLVEKVTTDENGQAIASTKLRPGKYYFKEIDAPKGYNVSDEKLPIEIKSGGVADPQTVVAKDSVILGSAKLIKVDSKTGGKLQGAVYGVYDSNNNLIEKVTTGSTGEVSTKTDLRPGKYYFKEITAPVGYVLSQTTYPFEIILGETTKVPEVTAKDDINLGSVNLTKEDSETAQKLQGAEFKLYSSDNTEIGTYKTDNNGNLTVNNLRPGDYYFVETKAPEGYNLDNSKHDFSIVLGQTEKAASLTVKDNIKKGSVNLVKEDSETAQKLQGAEFDLYKVNVKDTDSNNLIKTIKNIFNKDSVKIGTYTTDENGSITVNDLRPGNYYFVETKAPEGYNLDNSKHEFEIALGENDKAIPVVVKDDIKKGEAQLVKKDRDTNESLQGAVYGLYDSNNNLVEKVTTNKDGQAIVNTKLRPGKYYFKEIEAPKGYKISDEKLPLEIKLGGVADPQTIVAKDSVILGSAKLIKVDSKTGGKLKGAVYGVYDSNNNLIEQVTTGSNGEVSTKINLRPGKYYFKEITAPDGYEVNETKYPFEIVLGETTKIPEVTAKDDPIIISKNDNSENITNDNKKNTTVNKQQNNKNIIPKTGYEGKYMYLGIALIIIGLLISIFNKKRK